MAIEPSRVIDEAELRRIFIEREFLKHKRFLADVEEAADKTYVINLKQSDGTPIITLKVRRWKHKEVVLRYKLPFYAKFVANQPLDEAELRQYQAFQAEMVDISIPEFSQKHPEYVSVVYDTLCSISGLSKDHIDRLEEFINSEYGINYALVWLNLLKKTPSEVAELPETDIMLVEAIIPKMLERMKSG